MYVQKLIDVIRMETYDSRAARTAAGAAGAAGRKIEEPEAKGGPAEKVKKWKQIFMCMCVLFIYSLR